MSDRAIAWEEVSLDPAVRTAAAWVIQRGIWVGLLTDAGQSVSIGDSNSVEQSRPLCRYFKANPSDAESGGAEAATSTSCAGSLRAWREAVATAETASDEGVLERRCHAGFRARLAPIRVAGEVVGAVYASGYLESDESGELKTVSDETGAEGDIQESVPRLGVGELEALGATLEALRDRVEEILASSAASEEDGSLHHREGVVRFEEMVGASDSIRQLFDEIETIAPTETSVLVTGENGTGKELVARAIHRRSGRSDAPFVPLNCASLSPQLIASELFGHVEGAFSGANKSRRGVLAAADGGTLLLDELGEMPKRLQTKLLRFLENGEYSPVGSNRRLRADVRVLGATNRDIDEAVEAGAFRRDLYFRIGAARLDVPALRHRRADIEPLARHFLAEFAGRHGRSSIELSEGAIERLRGYDWPGNVRQLRNEVERAVIQTSNGGTINEEALALGMGMGDGGDSGSELDSHIDMSQTLPESIEELERKMISSALAETGWNKTKAAEVLDVSRRTLIRKVDEYGLAPDEG